MAKRVRKVAKRALSEGDLSSLSLFDSLPDDAFIRPPVVRAVCGGIGNTTLWAWVKCGRLPAPTKLGPQMAAWRVGDIRAVLAKGAA
jgi:predicted DNA-binding transcriptional regulator AlpA